MTYRTRPIVALGHRFQVATSDGALGAYLEELFAAMAAPAAAPPTPADLQHYRLLERPGGDAPVWELTRDGTEIVRTPDAPQALAMLLWDVNRTVVERTEGLLLLHAAAAERDGAAVLLPGAMEAGKTTMVAGLVRGGLRYLTDEVTAIDPRTGAIHPYPKALSVDPGSWGVLADLEPQPPAGVRRFLPDQWQVLPSAIRPGAVATGARPRLVVLPRWQGGAETHLRPLSPADAVVALAGCAFRIEEDPGRTLPALAGTLGNCPTYDLVYSDLDDGVRTVLDLLGTVTGEAPHDPRAQVGGPAPESTGGRGRGPRPATLRTGERPMARAIHPDEVALDFAPRRNGGITSVELDGEAVLYTGEGTMHKLDPIATALWNCFDGEVTLAELVEDLDSVYEDTPTEQITGDVLTCVRELGRQGLLENVQPPASGADGGPQGGDR